MTEMLIEKGQLIRYENPYIDMVGLCQTEVKIYMANETFDLVEFCKGCADKAGIIGLYDTDVEDDLPGYEDDLIHDIMAYLVEVKYLTEIEPKVIEFHDLYNAVDNTRTNKRVCLYRDDIDAYYKKYGG